MCVMVPGVVFRGLCIGSWVSPQWGQCVSPPSAGWAPGSAMCLWGCKRSQPAVRASLIPGKGMQLLAQPQQHVPLPLLIPACSTIPGLGNVPWARGACSWAGMGRNPVAGNSKCTWKLQHMLPILSFLLPSLVTVYKLLARHLRRNKVIT